MPFRVNEEKCDTCIFGPNSPIKPKRFQELHTQWETNHQNQTCHQSTVQHDNVACRGHYDAVKMGLPGFESYPVLDVGYSAGYTELHPNQILGMYEAAGYIRFVKVKKG